VPLTRVALAYIDQRFDLYLRFGDPSRIIRFDRWRRCAVFTPNAVLCRIRWQANDYGTIRWQLMVMQACMPMDGAQRIPGVQPGARLLLHAEGEQSVRAVLERINGIEALGITPATASPAYWRTLGNRLAARCHEHDLCSHCRLASTLAPARSPHAGGPVHLRPRCACLGVLRASAAAPDLQPIRQRGGRMVSRRSARPSHQLAATSVVRG